MTALEWFESADSAAMLEFVRAADGQSDRKLRLALCGLGWKNLKAGDDYRCRRALIIAADYADRLRNATPAELTHARVGVWKAEQKSGYKFGMAPSVFTLVCEPVIPPLAGWRCFRHLSFDDAGLCDVLRDHFIPPGLRWEREGDVLFPAHLDRPPDESCPTPLTALVLGVAAAAYAESDQDGSLDNCRLLVLSDALEDAGCTDRLLLDGLRIAGKVHRGFWPLDLILDKR